MAQQPTGTDALSTQGLATLPPGVLAAFLLTLFGVIGLLLAEQRNWQWARWTFKPLACAGFLLAGFLLEPANSPYGICIFVGLVLSVVGDVCLIPQGSGNWLLRIRCGGCCRAVLF